MFLFLLKQQIMKTKLLASAYVIFLCLQFCMVMATNIENRHPYSSEVPLAGNAFITTSTKGSTEVITKNGLGNWTNISTTISTYFKVSHRGILHLKLKAKVPSGKSVIKVSINGISHAISIKDSSYNIYSVGDFNVLQGYVKVDLQGVKKTGDYFADVSHIIFKSPSSEGDNIFCNDPNFYYWGRRGPSCHLKYTNPTTKDVLYFYNEITIPKGEDKIGSYFMADGFQNGYFGIQVNSETERRVLFSVWSPFSTDNPKDIPEDHKIKLNCKGKNVITGEFGNEGSGGQSYLQYDWKAGVTYKFLLKGEPDGTGNTDYTAWFFTPETNSWSLIASWKRPYTKAYLDNLHSFIENFIPDNGYQGRKAEFGNQWVKTTDGQWLPISQAKFTADATYKAHQRVDATGGTINNTFYLKNGAFTNDVTLMNSVLNVSPPTLVPDINLIDLGSCNASEH